LGFVAGHVVSQIIGIYRKRFWHHKRRQNLPLGVRLSEGLDPTALQVLNFYVAPLLFEVLSDKPSMAVMGGRFTAKQTCAV